MHIRMNIPANLKSNIAITTVRMKAMIKKTFAEFENRTFPISNPHQQDILMKSQQDFPIFIF